MSNARQEAGHESSVSGIDGGADGSIYGARKRARNTMTEARHGGAGEIHHDRAIWWASSGVVSEKARSRVTTTNAGKRDRSDYPLETVQSNLRREANGRDGLGAVVGPPVADRKGSFGMEQC